MIQKCEIVLNALLEVCVGGRLGLLVCSLNDSFAAEDRLEGFGPLTSLSLLTVGIIPTRTIVITV